MKNVDVIIPTHNCKFIVEAIDSVLNQSYPYINIYIIDDGSTDNTKEKVKNLLLTNPDKIHYLYQKQQGPAGARNTGIIKGTGYYIAFLDADDIWLPDKINKQLEVFKEKTDIGFVYCDNYFIDKNGRKIKDYVRKVKLVAGNILLDFFMDFFLITSSIILKRSCLETIGIFNKTLQVGEDFEFFLRLTQNFKAGVVQEKLFLRRVWKGSLSKQDYEKNLAVDIETLKKFISRQPTFYKNHKKIIKKRIAEMYFKFGYAYRIHGENLNGYFQSINSLKYYFNIKALKNLILCFIRIKMNSIFKKN